MRISCIRACVVITTILLFCQAALAGEISGTVAAENGTTISDGFVYIYDDTGSYLGLTSIQSDGSFSYPGLGPGTYFARTDDTGYLDELWQDIPCSQGQCNPSTGTAIEIAGTETVTASFTLSQGGGISGSVTAESGATITDGFVHVYDGTGSFLGLTSIQNDGSFSYPGLGSGTYFARTDDTGFLDELWQDIPCSQGQCDPGTGTQIEITGTETITANFILAQGGKISGTVMAESGATITDGFVNIYDHTGNYLGLTSIQSNGSFSYPGLGPGTYFARTNNTNFSDELWQDIPCSQGQCDPETGTPIEMTGTEVVNLDFILSGGGEISGTVTAESGATISDGFVNVYDDTGSFLGLTSIQSDGSFSYPGLSPGTYFARTDDTGYLDELWQDIPCSQGQCDPSTGTAIEIAGTETVTANFTLSQGGGISGTVTAETGATITDGFVHVYDSTGSFLGLTSIQSDGSFSYPGLGPGTYFARTDDTGYLDELWQDIACSQGQCDPSTGTAIEIVGTETVTANFLLSPGTDSDVIFQDRFN